MRKICVVVLIIALLSAGSPVFATIQAFKLGAVGQDSVTNTKVMCAYSTDDVRYMTLESPVGTDYVVTAGYTLYMTFVIPNPSTAGHGIVVGYGNDGVADGTSAPTGWVQLTERLYGSNTGVGWQVLIPIPAGKYPCIKAVGGACRATIFGLEIAN